MPSKITGRQPACTATSKWERSSSSLVGSRQNVERTASAKLLAAHGPCAPLAAQTDAVALSWRPPCGAARAGSAQHARDGRALGFAPAGAVAQPARGYNLLEQLEAAAVEARV